MGEGLATRGPQLHVPELGLLVLAQQLSAQSMIPIAIARSTETLLGTLPGGGDDDLLAINCGFERLGCNRQCLALYLDLSR